ncbi:MAG: hypothetical protein Q8Q94_01450 [bacterium]|nr:hypothetical protein [bacterium]MDZ4299568.1 hypothetical protein [Candidatus Sungbacteria bacterium]
MATAQKTSLALILLTGVIATHMLFVRTTRDTVRPLPAVIPAAVVRASDLGLHTMTASFLWLAVIQRLVPIGFDHLDAYIGQINDLDPKFSYPYAFGVLLLGGQENLNAAARIGMRGIAEADTDWRIPYYLAMNYHTTEDRSHAVYYFSLAARTPGAPENVRTVAANYGSRKTHRAQTEEIWSTLLDTSRDEVVRKQAEDILTHLKILDLLDQAASVYKKKFGSFPAKAEDLISGNILIRLPADPFNFHFVFDKDGNAAAVRP